MKNLIAGALAMAVLGLSGRSAGQAVEAPAVDAPVQDESESKDGGEPLLPEAAKSSLLWTLRTCHALLGIKPLRAREVRTCMAKAAEMLSRDPDDALKDARVGLLSVLSSSVEEKNAQHVARELVDKVDALRKAAGALRAKQDSSIVLISQGGVSLGSWQAGLLYLVSERLKQKPGRAPRDPVFPTITGASAGAVNSLISASASCENPVKRPEDSLFYKIWIELGLVGRHGSPGLLGESAETLALFDKKALAFAMKQATEHFEDTKRYADGPCEVQIGLTLTHLDDNELPVHQNVTGQTVITGPTLREQFALKLQFEKPSSGSERRSVLTARNVGAQRVSGSFLEPASTPSNRFPVLGEGRTADASVPTELVLDAVRASGAFPAAFPPVSLPFARLNAAGTVGETKRARFIDGGVFDNTPVGLAIELEEMRKQALPAPPQPSLAQAMVPEPPTTYLLIEPSAISWSLGNKDKANELESSNRGIVETYASFASRFIGSSRSAALVETIRRWPFLAVDDNSGLQSRLTAPRRHMPIAGEQLGAFLGFLERDFRVFDFYVGMADATVLLGGDQCFAGSMGPPPVWSDLVTSPEFTCMQAYYSKTLATRTRIRTGDLPTTCRSLGSAERKRIDGEIDLSALRAELSEKDEERARRSDAEIAVTASNFRALLVAITTTDSGPKVMHGASQARITTIRATPKVCSSMCSLMSW